MQIWGVLTDLVGFYISSLVIFKRRGSTALLQSFSSFFTLEKNTDLTLLCKKKPDNPQMTLRMQMREWKSFYSNSFTFSDQNILKNWAFCCHIPKMTEADNNNNNTRQKAFRSVPRLFVLQRWRDPSWSALPKHRAVSWAWQQRAENDLHPNPNDEGNVHRRSL